MGRTTQYSRGSASAEALESGARFGTYAIEKRLGSGGYSDVYLARNVVSEQEVALKVLFRRFEQGSEAARRIRTEAQVLLQVRSPHVVRFYEVGLERDRVWFALEYLKGTTLHNASNGQPVAVADAVRHGIGIARGLLALHQLEARVIHRDLKPGNVMVTYDGRTVLLDFGAAKMLGAPDKHRSRRVIGTVAYMAPERIATAVRIPSGGWRRDAAPGASVPGRAAPGRAEPGRSESGADGAGTEGVGDGGSEPGRAVQGGRRNRLSEIASTISARGHMPEVDERSDIFSLGTILYELLAGHHPHLPKGTPFSPLVIANDILCVSPAPLGEVAPQVPDSLAEIVVRCLCKDPRDRFESVVPLIEALEGVESELDEASRFADSAEPWSRSRFSPGGSIGSLEPRESLLAPRAAATLTVEEFDPQAVADTMPAGPSALRAACAAPWQWSAPRRVLMGREPSDAGSVPRSSVPRSSVPRSSVPRSSVPRSSVPRSSVPRSSVPRSSVPPPAAATTPGGAQTLEAQCPGAQGDTDTAPMGMPETETYPGDSTPRKGLQGTEGTEVAGGLSSDEHAREWSELLDEAEPRSSIVPELPLMALGSHRVLGVALWAVLGVVVGVVFGFSIPRWMHGPQGSQAPEESFAARATALHGARAAEPGGAGLGPAEPSPAEPSPTELSPTGQAVGTGAAELAQGTRGAAPAVVEAGARGVSRLSQQPEPPPGVSRRRSSPPLARSAASAESGVPAPRGAARSPARYLEEGAQGASEGAGANPRAATNPAAEPQQPAPPSAESQRAQRRPSLHDVPSEVVF